LEVKVGNVIISQGWHYRGIGGKMLHYSGGGVSHTFNSVQKESQWTYNVVPQQAGALWGNKMRRMTMMTTIWEEKATVMTIMTTTTMMIGAKTRNGYFYLPPGNMYIHMKTDKDLIGHCHIYIHN
jgi:hypothetical protein